MGESLIVRKSGGSFNFSGSTVSGSKVLTGYQFWNSNGVLQNGTMPDRGNVSASINIGESYTIQNGYHAGGGKVTAKAGSASEYRMVTEIITANTNWKVPAAKDNSFDIRIFGGGGASYMERDTSYEYSYSNYFTGGAGGGGGNMNNKVLNLTANTYIQINIGKGGTGWNGNAGGTTTFGSLLSATGGEGGRSTSWGYSGGNGGTGGGAGINYGGRGTCNGGHGSYGGGGGGVGTNLGHGGNGGTYGGGGGGYGNSGYTRSSGYGGTYGGNGAWQDVNATNGTNTIGKGLEFEGNGGILFWNAMIRNPEYHQCGGGGYGGMGGIGYSYAGGGGGGYGANGGNGAQYMMNTSNLGNTYQMNTAGGGGGGGYGHGGYGRGGTGGCNAKNGVCVIKYQVPIY